MGAKPEKEIEDEMEQEKNKEAGFGGRQTEHEETQSAREAARWEREAALERARRNEDICEAYDALCRCLDEQKIIFGDVKAIELGKLDERISLGEVLDVERRWKENSERTVKYLHKLTGEPEPKDDEYAIELI